MPPARRNTGKDSLAATAGDRVRAIIEAAEASAASIRAEAETEAEQIRARAQERATALRSEVRGDVEALLGSIRGAVERLSTDLERLEERLGESESESEPARPPVPAAPVETEDEDRDIALAEDAAVGRDEDVEGARLVALNMALDGAPRDEVARHLREKHGLAEPSGLLDEVYGSLGRS